MAGDIRIDPRVARRRRWIAPVAALLAALGVVDAYRPSGPPYVLRVPCGIGLGVCGVIVRGPWPRYRCPSCGMRLGEPRYGEPDRFDAQPIRYACPACDVVWDTGWTTAGNNYVP